MRIAVVGGGAMGSVYAALFAEAGHDVTIIDPWEDHVAAIARDGLRMTGASGNRTVAGINAGSDPALTAGCDLVVMATKAGAVADAARSIQPHLGAAPVITIQNGLGAADRIATYIDPSQLLIGVAEGFGAKIVAPGHAHHEAMKRIRLGEVGGGESNRLTKLTSLWQAAGFSAEAYADIDRLIWEKFICNVTFSAPCAVFDLTVGQLMADEDTWAVALSCTHEAFAACQAEGVDISFDDPVTYVTEFGSRMPDARPSLAIDHRAGRLSEIDAINGMVPVVSDRHGLDAPVNRTLAAIVRSSEKRLTSR